MIIDTTNVGIIKLVDGKGRERVFVPSKVSVKDTNVGTVITIIEKKL